MGETPNICAGPFGSLYDIYIERPRLMQAVGRTVWGIDASVLYESMAPIGRAAAAGATIADVPCGGGVAFRALPAQLRGRYVAGDLDARMLERARRRAHHRGLDEIELVRADMEALPLGDGEIDMFVSFSGLHMLADPARAIAEIARCLRPGGEVVGTSFLREGALRQRLLFGLGALRDHPQPPRRHELATTLEEAGFEDVRIAPERGFAAFAGTLSQAAS